LAIGGCASGPQYFPKQLEWRPMSERAELIIDMRTRDLSIDGERIRADKVFLSPGTHTVEYKIYGESKDWKELAKRMKEAGYTPSSDGRQFVNGSMSYTAIGMPKYVWNPESKKVTFEGGKKYWLSTCEWVRQVNN
jgi:hypothetical protein